MASGRLSVATVAAALGLAEGDPRVRRAVAFDREAARCEAEARRSIAARAGSERAWRERAARARGQALDALREGER